MQDTRHVGRHGPNSETHQGVSSSPGSDHSHSGRRSFGAANADVEFYGNGSFGAGEGGSGSGEEMGGNGSFGAPHGEESNGSSSFGIRRHEHDDGTDAVQEMAGNGRSVGASGIRLHDGARSSIVVPAVARLAERLVRLTENLAPLHDEALARLLREMRVGVEADLERFLLQEDEDPPQGELSGTDSSGGFGFLGADLLDFGDDEGPLGEGPALATDEELLADIRAELVADMRAELVADESAVGQFITHCGEESGREKLTERFVYVVVCVVLPVGDRATYCGFSQLCSQSGVVSVSIEARKKRPFRRTIVPGGS